MLTAVARSHPRVAFVPAGNALCRGALFTQTINGDYIYRDAGIFGGIGSGDAAGVGKNDRPQCAF